MIAPDIKIFDITYYKTVFSSYPGSAYTRDCNYSAIQ